MKIEYVQEGTELVPLKRADHEIVRRYERRGYQHVVFRNLTAETTREYMVKDLNKLETQVLKYDLELDDFRDHGIFKRNLYI